jgi:hypothetical protein
MKLVFSSMLLAGVSLRPLLEKFPHLRQHSVTLPFIEILKYQFDPDNTW